MINNTEKIEGIYKKHLVQMDNSFDICIQFFSCSVVTAVDTYKVSSTKFLLYLKVNLRACVIAVVVVNVKSLLWEGNVIAVSVTLTKSGIALASIDFWR